jgi:hypothetical protein
VAHNKQLCAIHHKIRLSIRSSSPTELRAADSKLEIAARLCLLENWNEAASPHRGNSSVSLKDAIFLSLLRRD